MSFDPYHRWLGIPPGEQPPNHYRLLGIAPLEDNPDVIESAADRQMGHLRNHQSGKHSALSQKLLNEVAAAKVCLLNPGKKAEYDSRLREQIEAAERPTAAEAAEPLEPGLAKLFEKTTHAPTVSSKAGRRVKPTQLWAGAGIVALGLVAVVVVVLIRAGGSSRQTAPSDGKAAALQGDRHKPPKAPRLPKGPSGATGQRPVPPPKDTGHTPAPPQRGPAPPPAVAPFDAAKAKEHQQAWANYLNVPVVGVNSIGMKLLLIPPGEFEMGSSQEEAARLLEEAKQQNPPADHRWYMDRIPSEAPRHRIKITRPFYLGLFEVTQAEYQRVMGSNPSQQKDDPNRPVEMVNWDDALEFCRKLSEMSKEKAVPAVYRLPTEAEWEYACRAGTTTSYSFGNDAALLEQYAWGRKNAQGRTQPVGQLKPNPWGLFDMHGNVWELCADWYASDYYAKSPTDDPTGPDSGYDRVVRGASYGMNPATRFRCAFRHHYGSHERHPNSGFRVAVTLAAAAASPRPLQPPQDTTTQTPVTPQPPAEKPQRLPVPAQAEREKLSAQLNEAYDLSKERLPSEKRKLAADLLALAHKAKERPAERYVLLDAAMRLAGEGGDAARMLDVADRIGDGFEIDVLALKAAALETFADGAKDSARIGALVDASEKLIAEALGQDKHDLARELADRAYAACGHSAGRRHRKRAFDRRNEVQALGAAWKQVQGALDKLKTDANDPQANLAAGRYFALAKGDWRKGLPMLALGSDAALKDLAAKELKNPESAEEQLAVADAWWDAAEKAAGQERDALRLHAGSWYQEVEAAPASTLVKAKVRKRLEEIGKLGRPIPELPARKPPPAVAPFDAKMAKRCQQRWAKHLNVPVVGANSIGMKFVLIPPGEFEMGSSQEEVERLLEEAKRQNAPKLDMNRIASEAPKHRVKITKPFYLGLYEVTQAEYERVMGNNPSKFSDDPSRPVEQVTWNEAVEFCRKLGELTKEKAGSAVYRLPTEAEWEYSCRAGTTTRYSFGDDAALLGHHASWKQPRTQRVGRLQPNAFGLFDMHGNVWEWCADWYAADYYGKSPPDDPTGPHSGSGRVMRGGSWNYDFPGLFRCAFRSNADPNLRYLTRGFRVAMTLRPGATGLQPASPPQATTGQK